MDGMFTFKKKRRPGKRKWRCRALGILMAAAMAVSMPGGASVYASGENAGLCEHHIHSLECGAGQPCSYVCPLCPAEDGNADLAEEILIGRAGAGGQSADDALSAKGAEISTQPQSKTVIYGEKVSLSVVVEGAVGTVSYQWYQGEPAGSGTQISGAQSSDYETDALEVGTYTFYCVVICDGEEVTSESAFIKVEPMTVTPSIKIEENGTLSKIYDGSTEWKEEDHGELKIALEGVLDGDKDHVTAKAKTYTFDDPDAGDEKTLTASGITLSGERAKNYRLSSDSVTTTATIEKVDILPGPSNPPVEESVTDTSIKLKVRAENEEFAIRSNEDDENWQDDVYDDGNEDMGWKWQDSPLFEGLVPNTKYLFCTRIKGDKNHNPSRPRSHAGRISTALPMLENAVVTISGTYTYNGTAQIPESKDVNVNLYSNPVPSDAYTFQASDNINAGTATLTITAKENSGYLGSCTGTFPIRKASLTAEGTGTAAGQYGIPLSELKIKGLAAKWETKNTNMEGTWQFKDASAKPEIGTKEYTAVFTPKDNADNFNPLEAPVEVTVSKGQGILHVSETAVSKTFGDEPFSLNCTTNSDGMISYQSDNPSAASVSEDGTVEIKGAGNAVVTVSLAETSHYTAADSQTVSITVGKAAAPVIPSETRRYPYAAGSQGEVMFDAAGELPSDRGETKYTVMTAGTASVLSGAAVDENGQLTFTVPENQTIGDKASITVTAEMANYEEAAFTVNIEIVDKIPVSGSVSLEDGSRLIYGETLSKLKFAPAVFVEQGTARQARVVEGSLEWKEPSKAPNVTETTAEWIFRPKDSSRYAEASGTVEIQVEKATPKVEELPFAGAVTYCPARSLADVGLTGGKVSWTVSGSIDEVKGSWDWKDRGEVPVADKNAYTVIFTPGDSVNYNTVETDVELQVKKAVPYIAALPSAAAISYGDSLNESELSGGDVRYGDGAGQAGSQAGSEENVEGTFAWKDGSAKPVVADSGVKEFAVVFTPFDGTNYESVELAVKLTVEPAGDAPGMPPRTMKVSRKYEKVGDTPLPEYSKFWQWQEADRDLGLVEGEAVEAVAEYVGEDRANYKNVTAVVAVIRSACDHERTELRDVVNATCEAKGYSGDTYCLVCGELLIEGIVTPLGDHSGGTANCIRGKICQVCGKEYTGHDSSNHENTEIRGSREAACTEEGYTGDTYCTDCGAKLSQGAAIPAQGHDWHITSEEKATTEAEGKRIYTCSKCGRTREEVIPKLPSEEHKHAYSSQVTKEASCTETGVKTYSCSCGDTYTEVIPATGHNYEARVTKEPTVTEEGERMYTCSRCGDSYTEPIDRLNGGSEDNPEGPGEGGSGSEPGDPGGGGSGSRPEDPGEGGSGSEPEGPGEGGSGSRPEDPGEGGSGSQPEGPGEGNGNQPEPSGDGIGVKSPQTGETWTSWWIIAAGGAVSAIGAGTFCLAYRKKEENE